MPSGNPKLRTKKKPVGFEEMPLTELRGVGPSIKNKFQNLGIHNIQDLLFHLPFRYQDRTRINDINRVRFGDHVQLEGELVAARVMFGKRRSLQCTLKDDTGFINLRFFYFTAAQKNNLKSGVRLRCYGEVRRGSAGYEIYHPEYRLLSESSNEGLEETLTPIYPSTEGLQQTRLRAIIEQAVALLEKFRDDNTVSEYLPKEVYFAIVRRVEPSSFQRSSSKTKRAKMNTECSSSGRLAANAGAISPDFSAIPAVSPFTSINSISRSVKAGACRWVLNDSSEKSRPELNSSFLVA